MRSELKKLAILSLLSFVWQASGNDATWTGAVSSDLTSTADNWSPSGVPSGIATFNSALPPTSFSPTAEAEFTIDTMNFTNSASAFQFTFTNAALTFTGSGITGSNTNTEFTFTNAISLGTSQFYFYSTDATSNSLGTADFSFTNSAAGTIFPSSSYFLSQNAAQLVLGDEDLGISVYPVTSGDNVSISLTNYGTINGTNEAGQIFMKGSTYTAGDQYTLYAVNSGADAVIESSSDTGQLVFDANNNMANFTLGNYAVFTFSNENGASIASNMEDRGNNAAQILFDGRTGTAAFTLGDFATLTLTNDNSAISTLTSGNDVGQMVFDGDKGIASLSAGNSANFTLSNLNGGVLNGLGFDTGQIVVDGDSGTASFSVGDNFTLVLNNGSGSTIETGSGGNDAGQLVVDGNSGGSSFTVGNQVSISITNSGTITNQSGAYAAQILFDGSQAGSEGVSLNAGNDVTITATNSAEGTIVNDDSSNTAAQMYFSSVTINGTPTLVAINQHPSITTVQGIVFDGTSDAIGANIQLQNSSLIVDTSAAEFYIGSLSGDSSSEVKLSKTLALAGGASGATYEFAGVISDAIAGTHQLVINGSGTQVLSGSNSCTGSTLVKAPLVLTGSIVHDVAVQADILSGTGSIGGNLTVDDETTVSPLIGNGSTLSVGGAFTINDGATANFEINEAGENSKLAVTGLATIQSEATVNVTQDPGTHYPRSGRFEILTAGSQSGAFNSTVTGGLPGFIFSLSYEDPSVYLSYDVAPIPTSGLTGNALKMADYLNKYGSGSTVALFSLLSDGALSEALNSASPSRNAFVPYIEQQVAFSLSALLTSHIDLQNFSFAKEASDLLADASDVVQQKGCRPKKVSASSSPFSAWASGFGEYARGAAREHNPSFHFISGAALAGFDYKWKNRSLVGGALGYAYTHFYEERAAGSGKINDYFASAYGNFFIKNFYISPAFWGLFNQSHNTRHIFFPGFSAKAKAHIYSWQLVPHLELGYDCRFSWGDLVPFSSLDWAIIWQRGYSEKGAAPFDARSKSKNSSMARSETGLKFCEKWSTSWGAVLLREKASYVFQKPFGTGTVTTALTGIPASFTVTAVNQNLNLGVAAIDCLFAIGKKDPISIDLGYEGEVGSNYWSNQLMLTLRKDF